MAIVEYKESKDLFILGNNEDLISKIDDTTLNLNNMLGSRFVEEIRYAVEEQMKQFKYLEELLDEWMVHQKNWIYLEPIFSGT